MPPGRADGITHEAYGGIGKPSNGPPCGAKKSPAWKQGLVGGSRPGREVPIDEQGIIPLSLFRCDGDHKFTLSAPLVEKVGPRRCGPEKEPMPTAAVASLNLRRISS